ncbi:MAG: helix-turn-helix transcriptional regulator, partial [Acidimicrobiales bacterium]
ALFSTAGQWYLLAHCQRAGAARLFRVDRIRRATAGAATFDPPASPAPLPPATYHPADDDPVVVLELDPPAQWVGEQYPNEGVERLGGGRVQVRLRASERAWLERLLLRLGPHARVVEGPAGVRPAAAARVLRRYRQALG